MRKEFTLTGTALCGEDFEARDVRIIISNGIIQKIEDETHVPPKWIIPAFFNAHTHLGDTVAMDLQVKGTLAELVTPPDGLKHRILTQTPYHRLVRAMRSSIREMLHNGTCGFADFREGGEEGVKALLEAAKELPCRPVILGRDGGENFSDGAGISSARDIKTYSSIVKEMKKARKLVAFHAGEHDSEDIDAALNSDPDLLIHCTHATKDQIREIADRDISVAVCPRSNFMLGTTRSSDYPPIQRMLNEGVKILFGTDNVMFVQPDIMNEIAFSHTVYDISPLDLIKSGASGFPPLGIDHRIIPGNKAAIQVYDASWGNLEFSHDKISTIIKRAPIGHLNARIFYV